MCLSVVLSLPRGELLPLPAALPNLQNHMDRNEVHQTLVYCILTLTSAPSLFYPCSTLSLFLFSLVPFLATPFFSPTLPLYSFLLFPTIPHNSPHSLSLSPPSLTPFLHFLFVSFYALPSLPLYSPSSSTLPSYALPFRSTPPSRSTPTIPSHSFSPICSLPSFFFISFPPYFHPMLYPPSHSTPLSVSTPPSCSTPHLIFFNSTTRYLSSL